MQEDEYEWFKGFAEFRHLLLPHLKPCDRILILGCGNSLLPLDLWREGFREITSVDLSPAVIQKMAARTEAEVRLSMPLLYLRHPIPQALTAGRGTATHCHTSTPVCALGQLILVNMTDIVCTWRGKVARLFQASRK